MSEPETHDTPMPLRIEQRRFGVRAFFEFNEEVLHWGLDDVRGLRTRTAEYADLAQEREQLEQREAGWGWLARFAFLSALFSHWFSVAGTPLVIAWLAVGVVALGVQFGLVRRYTVIASPRGDVMVPLGDGHDEVLDEIDRRRAAQLRERFDYLSPDESPEQQRHRVLWLQRQGSLDANEVSARLLQIDLMAQVPPSNDGDD